MAKKSKNPSDLLQAKCDTLDWHKFNFLENLFVFRVLADKSVPAESGVKFRVTPKDSDKAVCLLFRIDKKQDSLFQNDEIRPDYMVWYVRKDLCLCTIIEMKGKGGKDLVHGIDQIKALKERLIKEMKDSIFSKFKVKFQAILLSQFNADIPRKKIEEEDRKGLTILPIPYSDRAELFNYVSKINRISEGYVHENIRPADNLMFIEKMLTNYALPERLADNFSTSNKTIACNKEGIYINYHLFKEEYSAIAIDNAKMKIGVKESADKFANKIKSDLSRLGLKPNQHFEIEKIN